MFWRWLLYAFVWLVASGASAPRLLALDWLAFGDLRGHLESCGCDPQSDFGGVSRIASLLARERLEHPELLVFDLGNDFFIPPKPGLKTRYLAKALERMSVHAVLLNQAELMFPPSLWGARPFVLSNGRGSHPAVLASRRYIETPQAVILGYITPAFLPEGLLAWQDFEQGLQGLLAKDLAQKPKVLLFSGSEAELEKACASGQFALIISSHTAAIDAKPVFADTTPLEPLQRRSGAQSVPMVPLGGVGVLRGGLLWEKKAPSLKELLHSSQILADKSLSHLPSARPPHQAKDLPRVLTGFPVSWLDRSYEDHSPLLPLMQAYQEEAKVAFAAKMQQRLAGLQQSPFAGAASCQACHTSAYKAWEQSKHAHAYKTLQDKGKHEDGECVSCHVLGFQNQGGFVSLATSPHLANVQCENCHGPRKEHVQNPMGAAKPTPKERPCGACHQSTHSPAFDSTAYWEQIKHGKDL